MSGAVRCRFEVLVLGLSAPLMIVGLATVALAETWSRQGAGFLAVAGGSVALAGSRWRTRIFAWLAATLGVILALQVRQ